MIGAPIRTSVLAGAGLAIAGALAGAWAAVTAPPPADDAAMLAEAIANLELQEAKLARQDGASCPQDFIALDTGRPLRISLFYGYDDHDGTVRDRAHAGAMHHILTSACRGRLSACGFTPLSRTDMEATLARTLGGRPVEVHLFTTSLPEAARETQEELSRAAKRRFYRELVASDVVFYSGHSRLGGGMGFDDQSGMKTLVDSFLRRPLVPVIEALSRRPTNLKLLALFSCESDRYFRGAFEEASPGLSLILTTGDLRYAPGEQTSLGALEAILSRYCGRAFHDSMVAASEPDPEMTRLHRGRSSP